MKLEKIKGNTYIINNHNKVGIYIVDEKNAIIIDTGIDEESGKEIMDICKENNWKIKMVLNTHSHPDHIGGNKIIQDALDVPIYACKTEKIMIENPFLIGVTAYGGFPHKYLNNEYLLPKSSKVSELTTEVLPDGIKIFPLSGHNGDMVGFKTADDVYFLADAIAGANIITKYRLQFMFDVNEYFKTIEYISNLGEGIFIPSHGDITSDIKSLAILNKSAALEIIESIRKICKDGVNFDILLKELTLLYHIKLDFIQHNFIGSTLRCYLAYMLNENLLEAIFIDNELIWKTK